jgi:hypothetical protein
MPFLIGPKIAPDITVKFWESSAPALKRPSRSLRHEFVIGPLCDSNLSPGKARLYYCIKCKWSFLVCGSEVAVLDEDGSPLIGKESLRRFNTFEEGPCPVLEAFVSAALPHAGSLRLLDSSDFFRNGRQSWRKRAGAYHPKNRSWRPIRLV